MRRLLDISYPRVERGTKGKSGARRGSGNASSAITLPSFDSTFGDAARMEAGPRFSTNSANSEGSSSSPASFYRQHRDSRLHMNHLGQQEASIKATSSQGRRTPQFATSDSRRPMAFPENSLCRRSSPCYPHLQRDGEHDDEAYYNQRFSPPRLQSPLPQWDDCSEMDYYQDSDRTRAYDGPSPFSLEPEGYQCTPPRHRTMSRPTWA